MGVRLVRYSRFTGTNGSSDGSALQGNDHDELINRDLLNQHPIYAITGLQEVLNLLEDSIQDIGTAIPDGDKKLQDQINEHLKTIGAIKDKINALEESLNALKAIKYNDTNTVDLTYATDTSTLEADVKIWTPDSGEQNTNAIQVSDKGLYVPKFTSQDSATITWSEKVLGESLNEIFTDGVKFSHDTSSWSNHFETSEENSWYWDNNLQSFVQSANSSYFTGFISKKDFDCYTHSCTIKSTDNDDDANGLVIGYKTDEDGYTHTLTVLCDRGGLGGNTFAVWYNYYHPGATRIAYKTFNTSGAWNSVPNGIFVEVKKYGNQVSVCCSQFNSTELDESMRLNIDLSTYSFGHLFNGPVQYGYCNISQKLSYFQNVSFVSSYVATSTIALASVKISNDPLNCLEARQDGLWVKDFVVSPDENNILECRDNGCYVPDNYRLSSVANNAILKEDDGLWAEKFLISPDVSNALVKKDNGYFVKEFIFNVSPTSGNGLKLQDDGYYVRDNPNYRSVTQTNHGLVVGDFIYYHPSGKYYKAQALDTYASNIVGMVTKVMSVNTFEYQWAGFFETSLFSIENGYTQGMPLFISDTEEGKVTQTQPEISKTVGYPVENKGVIISIERGIQYNGEASIGDFKISANTYRVRSDGFILVLEYIDYKQSLIQRLLDTVSQDFKNKYLNIDYDQGIVSFKNTVELYEQNRVPDDMNLFIKAF